MSVNEWRSQLGQLRQGAEAVVVMYRRRPTAIMVPVPPPFWQNPEPFGKALMATRDEYLKPPYVERAHRWVKNGYQWHHQSMDDARRGTAELFAYITRNTPVCLTFYEYANAAMVPVPPDVPEENLERIFADLAQLATIMSLQGLNAKGEDTVT
jgi:hypothetical protein